MCSKHRHRMRLTPSATYNKLCASLECSPWIPIFSFANATQKAPPSVHPYIRTEFQLHTIRYAINIGIEGDPHRRPYSRNSAWLGKVYWNAKIYLSQQTFIQLVNSFAQPLRLQSFMSCTVQPWSRHAMHTNGFLLALQIIAITVATQNVATCANVLLPINCRAPESCAG